ncbi:hypothetical protein ACFVYC_16190 [Pseudarthrobacter sp. NPDC058329]|uniref:hypothetical protein n=1 Tax=Pseudarthrobacter sp. NPDC058329 TaxID=3346448 RepID=UPI0036D8BE8B
MSSPQDPYQPGQPGQAPPQPPLPPQQLPGNSGRAFPAPAGTYPEAGPFGLPGQHPPAKNRRKLWIILAGIGGVLLLVVLGIVILINVAGSATNQARGLADGFTKMVIGGQSSQAYDEYLDPALKEQLSKEAFIAGVDTLEMDESCKPTYNDLQVSTDNGVKAADVAGVITCGGKEVDLAYRFEGTEDLKMTNIKLRPKA